MRHVISTSYQMLFHTVVGFCEIYPLDVVLIRSNKNEMYTCIRWSIIIQYVFMFNFMIARVVNLKHVRTLHIKFGKLLLPIMK